MDKMKVKKDSQNMKNLTNIQSVKISDSTTLIMKLVDELLDATSTMSNSPSVNEQWSIHLVIADLLFKIKRLEAEYGLKTLSQRNEQSIEKLTKWALKNGAILNGVEVFQLYDGTYGMKSKQNLLIGEKIVIVPKTLMITEENISSSPLRKLHSQDMMLRNMPNVALAIFILVESLRKDKTSFWNPYLSTLPESYSTPVYFEIADLEMLRGSPSFETALKLNRNIARQYAYFKKLFQLSNDPASMILKDTFTYEYYRWAVSTLMSRQNFIPSLDNSSGSISALIPLWDMFNHHNGKLSTDFIKSDNTCVCYADRDYSAADRDYSAADQVFIFYGVRTNADFMVHNGFVYADNEHDAVKIRLGVSKSDPLYALRYRLLQTLSLPALAEFSLTPGPCPVDGQLLAFVRIFNMDKKTLDEWIAQEEKSCLQLTQTDMSEAPLCASLEIKCWQFLQVRISLLLRQYPPVVATVDGSKEKQPSKFQRLASTLIGLEKEILKNTLEYIQKRLNEMPRN